MTVRDRVDALVGSQANGNRAIRTGKFAANCRFLGVERGMILEKADTASPYGQDDGILTERVRGAAEEMRVSYVPNASDPDDRRFVLDPAPGEWGFKDVDATPLKNFQAQDRARRSRFPREW